MSDEDGEDPGAAEALEIEAERKARARSSASATRPKAEPRARPREEQELDIGDAPELELDWGARDQRALGGGVVEGSAASESSADLAHGGPGFEASDAAEAGTDAGFGAPAGAPWAGVDRRPGGSADLALARDPARSGGSADLALARDPARSGGSADLALARDPARPGPAAGGRFTCPKCQTPQPQGEQCVRCGVIFARYRPPAPGAVRTTSGPGRAAGASAGSAPAGPAALGVTATPVPVPGPSAAWNAPRGASGPAPAAAAPPPQPGEPLEPLGTRLGQALTLPFLGKGPIWILIMVALLLATAFIPFRRTFVLAVYVGLLANYFAKALGIGLDGDHRGLDLPKIAQFRQELVLPGLALILLTAVLFAFPVYQANAIAEELARSVEAAARGELPGLPARVEVWTPGVVYFDESGKMVEPRAGDPPRLLRGAAGWARVSPSEGTIVPMPPGFDPTAHQPGAELPEGVPPITAPKMALVLLFLGMMLPFVYLPMALAVACTGNPLQMFNPIAVLGGVVRAGVSYLGVVAMGAGAVAVPLFIAVKMLVVGVFPLFPVIGVLAAFSYSGCVQGYLLGCLIRSRPEILPSLAAMT